MSKQVLIATHIGALLAGFLICVAVLVFPAHKTSSLQVDLQGADSVGIGEVVQYSAAVQNKPWFSDVVLQWELLRDNQVVPFHVLDNSNIVFGSGSNPGKVLVLLNGVKVTRSWLFWHKVEALPPIAKEVTIGSGPGPEPGPTPNPTPAGPTDGKYKIAVLAWQTANDKVTDSNKVALFKDVAANYNTVADSITKGDLSTIQQIFAKLKELNGPLLNGKYASIKTQYTEWDKVIQAYIYNLYTTKVLTGVPDYAVLFSEIGNGLSYVK